MPFDTTFLPETSAGLSGGYRGTVGATTSDALRQKRASARIARFLTADWSISPGLGAALTVNRMHDLEGTMQEAGA